MYGIVDKKGRETPQRQPSLRLVSTTSATLIPNFTSVSESAVPPFSCHTQERKPTSKLVPQDPLAEQELRAVKERVLQQRTGTLGVANSGCTRPTNQYGTLGLVVNNHHPHPPLANTTLWMKHNGMRSWTVDHGRFDDIVCGSGPCALAYIDKALELDPKRKILVLERGDLEHVLKFVTEGQDFWGESKKLLHVIHVNELGNEEFRNIQKYIDGNLQGIIAKKKNTTADYEAPASLAVGGTTARSQQVFETFSTPGPLLDIYERQRQLAKKKNRRLYIDPDDPQKRANELQTSRGSLCFPGEDKPNIILATGSASGIHARLDRVDVGSTRRYLFWPVRVDNRMVTSWRILKLQFDHEHFN
ncbi:hypothetical protein HD554DRAFT_2039364 [Boletus coccyginus]|nr:hypothetical protein HD554DRAFT_2039364 [Boletus coccyginus]